MLAACGIEVLSLQRSRFGSVALGDLTEGQWRHLTRDEVRGLRRIVEQAYIRKQDGSEDTAGEQGVGRSQDTEENRKAEGK